MKKTILFVEDNDQTRDLYTQILADEGFSIDVVTDGREAYATLQKKKYDLMLLDLMMSGMDGLALLDLLKNKKNNAKIVIFSNISPDNVMGKMHGVKISDYIVKSDTRPDIFVDKIKKLLN